MKTRFLLLLTFCIFQLNARAQSNYAGSGIAMNFNGNNGNYVDLGDSYNTLNFPFTVEGWTQPSAYSSDYPGIFGSDNGSGNYYGFWVRIRSTGTLEVEFGDGFGAGSQFRRGFHTTEAVPLNKWIHLAVVCNSVTDVHIYFNGVEKNIVLTDGTSENTVLTHSSDHASIGRTINTFNESNFFGKIDEVRLWNASRTMTDIRDNMCRKINPSSPSLIGYWKTDESYTSGSVADFSSSSVDGTIMGSVPKVTSGAAIGDASEYLYTSNFAGESVSIFSASGERLGADTITGNPYGVHVYRIDTIPYYTTNLSETPPFYFGIFCAESNATAHYTVFYRYRNNNGLFNPDNETNLTLMNKTDDAAFNWTNLNGHQNLGANRIKKNNQVSRGDYILNFVADGKFASGDTRLNDLFNKAYPNPAANFFMLDLPQNSVPSSILLYDLGGKLLISKQFTGSHVIVERGALQNGMYLYSVISNSQPIATGTIIFQ